MIGGERPSKRRRFFTMTSSILLITNAFLIGISTQVPNVHAVSVNHTVGNLDIKILTDYGRVLEPLSSNDQYQTVRDGTGFGLMGLVFDQDNYVHTPGAENIADSYSSYPYAVSDDLEKIRDISMIIDDGTTQKSFGAFQNTGAGTGDADDILIEQTVWTVQNKDWAILQWKVRNLKAVPLTGVCIGLEVPISKAGATGGAGLGGDNGDDIDGYDAGNDFYWASDDSGISLGLGSAIPWDPITHYFSEDYHANYITDYKDFFGNDTWLYQRLHASNNVVGTTPGNRTTTVGWNGVTIDIGSFRRFTLVVAINDSYGNMITAMKDAQYYYANFATGFRITEFSDDPAGQKIEIFNDGRDPTDIGSVCSLQSKSGALFGSWNPSTIQPYEYSVFTVSSGTIETEGDTIILYENSDPVDEISFGQDGTAPDPLNGESTAREQMTEGFKNSWLRDATPTWGVRNNVGTVLITPLVVLNRVMFNPLDPVEGYVELRCKYMLEVNITGYKIVCDDEFIIPTSPPLNSSNRFYVFKYSDMPAFFTEPNGLTSTGDNVYLYDNNDNLLDMVGWSSSHNQGRFMTRMPDGNGTYQGYNDVSSSEAGWIFNKMPTLLITEFFANGTSAQIELYNPRGGDKYTTTWSLWVNGGPLTGTLAPDPIPGGGYSIFNMNGGTPRDEGDTIRLYYGGSNLIDEVSYGIMGIGPDPVPGESTARIWDDSTSGYTNIWTRCSFAGPSWGSQNNVAPISQTPKVIMNEVMFNPTTPTEYYLTIINIDPVLSVDLDGYSIVCDSEYKLSTHFLNPGEILVIDYFSSPLIFDNMDATGDNVYLYNTSDGLTDMVGWNTAHNRGMSVRRVPDGSGSYQGYNDVSSQAAGWVFNTPIRILITEISDSESSPSQIEIFNPGHLTINFDVPEYTFESDSGSITGTWTIPTAASEQYALFEVSGGTLNYEGDTISFKQNGFIIEEVSYGINGVVPDPLKDESVQRLWDNDLHLYTDIWERNLTTGPTFGALNNVQGDKIFSSIMLNEVFFYPDFADYHFVELFNPNEEAVDISGYRIVGDTEYIIPDGTILDSNKVFFYLFYNMNNEIFDNMDATGDNIYLYDSAGFLLDMVGWNSQHEINKTVHRIFDGYGTRDGYDDGSSISAGWRFDCYPTVQLIKVKLNNLEKIVKYGHFESYVTFELVILNFQIIPDLITIQYFSEQGWSVGIFEETGIYEIESISINADDFVNIVVNVTLPDSIPLVYMDNITILVRSSNSVIIGDIIILQALVYPFLNLTKNINPGQIFVKGTGHDEITTITLNLTGMGPAQTIRNLDCVFCIDSSGSMTGNDPDDLRKVESQNFIVNYFREPDRAAVVDFDDDAYLQPYGWPIGDHLSSDYMKIIDNIDLIDSSGGTRVYEGLNLSNEELRLYGQPAERVPIIILITDALTGDPPACLEQANISASLGVTIFTVGLMTNGSEAEQLLMDIASITGGKYYEAPDASYFKSIYMDISGYLNDIAVWDNNLSDPYPMVRDVLPWYIDFIPDSFSIPPDNIYKDILTGETIIEWNLPQIKINESWSVSFDVVSNIPGLHYTNVYNKSRAFFTRWDETTETEFFPKCWVDVLSPDPLPPRLYIDILPNKDDIFLYWDEPPSIDTDHYLIYRAKSPIGFDFSSPWVDTSNLISNGIDPIGLQVIPLRRTWNHTEAAHVGDPEYSEQWYYCIRTVNSLGEISRTSRTVGKWTKEFTQQGVSTFSLPLEPLETMTPTVEFYVNDMGANYIKWMDPKTHMWMQHGSGFVNDTILKVGKGYEVEFLSSTKYTFLGMPGSHILYNSGSFSGFDYGTEADSLYAIVPDHTTGNVHLYWAPPDDVEVVNYNVLRSTTRDGFDDGSAILLAELPVGTETYIDLNAAAVAGQNYYMIVPINVTGAKGSSTYSIGVWTEEYLSQYDTFGIPLNPESYKSADWFCDNIPDCVGINYYLIGEQRWSWHSTRMPEGAFDAILVMTAGFQISTFNTTKFIFIGI